MDRGKRTIVLSRASRWWEKPRDSAQAFIVAKPVRTPFGDSQYYTVKEVARMLRVNPLSIYDWVKAGRMQAQRLPGSRSIRFLGQSLNEDLARAQCREYADSANTTSRKIKTLHRAD